MKMNGGDLETLNVVQVVLRHLMVSLVAASKADMAQLGEMLEIAATNDAIDPIARSMLADLASGATGLGALEVRKQ